LRDHRLLSWFSPILVNLVSNSSINRSEPAGGRSGDAVFILLCFLSLFRSASSRPRVGPLARVVQAEIVVRHLGRSPGVMAASLCPPAAPFPALPPVRSAAFYFH